MINMDELNSDVLECQFSGIGAIVQKANTMNEELIRLEIGDTDYTPPKMLMMQLLSNIKMEKLIILVFVEKIHLLVVYVLCIVKKAICKLIQRRF